jgi:hypothetical protein
MIYVTHVRTIGERYSVVVLLLISLLVDSLTLDILREQQSMHETVKSITLTH